MAHKNRRNPRGRRRPRKLYLGQQNTRVIAYSVSRLKGFRRSKRERK